MSCDTKPEVLMAYLDGELDPIERGRVAEHIVGCAECRGTVNDLRAVSGALARWQTPEPAQLPSAQELLATAGFEPAKKTGSWTSITSRWGQVAALVLVAGVTAVLVVPRFLGEKSRSQGPLAVQSDQSVKPSASPAQGQPGASPTTTDTTAEKRNDGSTVGADGQLAEAPAEPNTTGPAPPPPPSSDAEAGVVAQNEATTEDTRDMKKEAQPAAPADQPTGYVEGGGAAAPEPPKLASAEEKRAEAAPAPASGVVAGRAASQPATAGARKPDARSNLRSNQIRRGVLRLEAPDLNVVVDRIDAEAHAASGRVTRRGSVQAKQEKDSITVEIEVPAESFDRAFARIKGLGTVKSETQSSVDISARLDELDDEQAAAGDKDSAAKSKTSGESVERERKQLEDRAKKATIVVTVVRPN